MDKLPDPRWQGALDHSRYLSNLLASRPALIDELAEAWTPVSYTHLDVYKRQRQWRRRRLGQRHGQLRGDAHEF